ncbi:MAG TPA: DUF2784 domain-containing protein [Acidobacteriaceae bacterium]|jgi:hypothetical protein|nr:DUF2784 domain-containing protein [Acidobacteriaceae bacterium]
MNLSFYSALAATILVLHIAWILWVVFGAFWTKGRPWLTAFHIASLLWGIIVEIGPWPCPLTLTEDFFESKAGIGTYSGSFLVHYLDRLVYPNIPVTLLIVCGVSICIFNLAIYVRRYWVRRTWLDGHKVS